jgi:hypothetical protein
MRDVLLVPSNRLDILCLGEVFDMYYTDWNNIEGVWPTTPGTPGAAESLGGTFASPPAAVAVGSDNLEVFGLGLDYAVYHKSYDAAKLVNGSHWSPAWERLGGNFTCTPVVVSDSDTRIDLFGLDLDHSMVHRTRNGATWTDWEALGGCFASPPVVLSAGGGKFDIFARGADFMVYHLILDPSVPGAWALLGGGLLAEPTAASAPAAVRIRDRLYVFVVGADGAMWRTWFDGKLWKPWTSIGVPFVGGTFVSEPAVTALFSKQASLGGFTGGGNALPTSIPASPGVAATISGAAIAAPGRIDVFAAGSDHTLWHNWLDQTGWQANWVSLGGSLDCAPSVVAPNNVGLTVFSMPPVHFNMALPVGREIHLLSFDGTNWTHWDHGPMFKSPSSFHFSITGVEIDHLRSAHTDTDYATASFAVGKWPLQTASWTMGNVGTGGQQLNFNFPQELSCANRPHSTI